MKKFRTLAYIQLFYAFGIIVFWIYFFAVDIHNPELSAIYLGHEKAFPVPDLGFLVPCLILSSIGLLKGKYYGLLFSLLSGSSLIFLSLLDTTFSIQQGIFMKSPEDALVYGFFCIALLFLGFYSIIITWKHMSKVFTTGGKNE